MNKYTIDPAEQRVVIISEEPEDRIGLIYVPDSAKKEGARIGTIVKVGTGSMDNPMEYRVGQLVMFSQYAGSEFEMDMGDGKKTYSIMNQMDIWGVVIPLT